MPDSSPSLSAREPVERRFDLRADVFAGARYRRDTERGVERVGERACIGEALERRAREAALKHAHDRARQRRLGRRTGEIACATCSGVSPRNARCR